MPGDASLWISALLVLTRCCLGGVFLFSRVMWGRSTKRRFVLFKNICLKISVLRPIMYWGKVFFFFHTSFKESFNFFFNSFQGHRPKFKSVSSNIKGRFCSQVVCIPLFTSWHMKSQQVPLQSDRHDIQLWEPSNAVINTMFYRLPDDLDKEPS